MGPLVENQGLQVHWHLAGAMECQKDTTVDKQLAFTTTVGSLLSIVHSDLHTV